MSREPRFDFSFSLTPRIAKRGSACGLEQPFGSLVYEALECNKGDSGTSQRFKRQWTDKQFQDAIRDVWSHGYRIGSVTKERAREPGTPAEFRIEDSDLYEGFGSTMKIKKDTP